MLKGHGETCAKLSEHYYSSEAYKSLTPWQKKHTPLAGAALPLVHGYETLKDPSVSCYIRTPSTGHLEPDGWVVDYRTEAVARVSDSMCCGQAMLCHGTGMTLDELGLSLEPKGTRLSFGDASQPLRQQRQFPPREFTRDTGADSPLSPYPLI